MTPSSIRGRPRRATSHISVRVAHALLGAVVAVLWLVWPELTASSSGDRPVARTPAPGTTAQDVEETPTADLVLPLIALGTAAALAAYGYIRRTRRTRTRTTPGGVPSAARSLPSPLSELDEQAQALLIEADDCVRTSREELTFAEAASGHEAMDPFARAVREAEWELSAAFAMRQRYDDGVPFEASARRQALAGIVGRCTEAGRRLDTEAAGFDAARGLERRIGAALEVAEARFREVAGRTSATEATLADLGRRYASTAAAPVVGYVEQAKDRLVFTTVHLNQARQSADRGEPDRAAAHLRAAEGAVDQAAIFVTAVDRLAGELSRARTLVPAALTGAEVEIAGARERAEGVAVDIPAGELQSRIMHADAVLTAVRETLTSGPYDPLDALRRIVRAVVPVATGRAGVLPVAGELVARSATATAADFVATHRGVVGAEARTRLAAAQRLMPEESLGTGQRLTPEEALAAGQRLLLPEEALTAGQRLAPEEALGTRQRLTPEEALAADSLARTALHLAEQDVRMHGTPVPAAPPHSTGFGGAVLGGIVLAQDSTSVQISSFGGRRTRARRNFPVA
ncbi:hypothetical protein I2W78_12965 [Streptomyces spinoverrucosus]|uniref:hypothetical protein n=1 Tax=Streptomyces spinoverrucosus TaxID=284043 RepID=UPI0018C35ED5|nr:hypothetical protein [Streptomyces spinoverrucosus]MBG0852729.1 hypothetical protein [Streptomyces spinoverrucosus]